MTSRSDVVMLNGGLTLPVAALQLAWSLEARGIHMGIDGDMLTIGPRELLTEADRAVIRRWRLHLLAIVAYAADSGQERM
jgi:hypothetical protein